MNFIKRALTIIILTFVVAVGIQNMEMLTYSLPFKFLQSEPILLPSFLWFLLLFGTGFLSCYLFDLKKSFSRRNERKKMDKELNSLRSELDKYRTQFLDNDTKELQDDQSKEPAD